MLTQNTNQSILYACMKRLSLLASGFLMLFGTTGCKTTNLGPQALRNTHPSYNQEIVNSLNEQLLANIVRMRYRDNPYFLDIKAISQAQKWSGNISLDVEGKTDPTPTNLTFKPTIGATFEENPNITYSPLEGQDFIQKLLRPVQTTVVLAMIQSGWRLDRIFDICVERVNDLRNAPTASGPTPALTPEYKKFKRFVELLRIMQLNDLYAIGEDPVHAFPDKIFRIKNDDRFAKEIAELKQLADLGLDRTDYKIKDNFIDLGPKRLTLRCRSLMGIFFFLSQGVEVPPQDEAAGLVTVTRNTDGTKFDWHELSTCFFNVRCSEESVKPKNAFAAVHYRNKWFYIADNDLESKTTFMLLTQIFNLQSAHLKSNEPILTLPIK